MGKDRVAYFYDSALPLTYFICRMGKAMALACSGDLAEVYYGANHPMKPHRMCMAHSLILGYGLHEKMEVYRPRRLNRVELAQFHSEDYVEFLEKICPERLEELGVSVATPQFGLDGFADCPVFDKLWEFCQISAGGSVDGATRLNHGTADIAINWAGGLHHAKKAEASGFCYVNDLVLAILELLKYHARVLYIDIDVHHGDGVEEAFYLTDRVMTVSFHRYGLCFDHLGAYPFFPGTGELHDVGERHGKNYSVNVPLKAGTTDAVFLELFKPVMARVMETYQPGAVVLQCGADSLQSDRLGCFNLSIAGHAEAVRFMKAFGVPMLVTGGGGYTKNNVARCWAYETAVVVGADADVTEEIPLNPLTQPYYEYFGPEHRLNLHTTREAMVDENVRADLERIRMTVIEQLRQLESAPGVQMSAMPPDAFLPAYNAVEEQDPDERLKEYCRSHLLLRDREPANPLLFAAAGRAAAV